MNLCPENCGCLKETDVIRICHVDMPIIIEEKKKIKMCCFEYLKNTNYYDQSYQIFFFKKFEPPLKLTFIFPNEGIVIIINISLNIYFKLHRICIIDSHDAIFAASKILK